MMNRRFCGRATVALLTILALGLASPAVPAMAKSSSTSIVSPQFGDLQRAIAVQSAQAYIDGAAFHELKEALAQTGQIDPGTIGTVRNARAVAGLVPWPPELAPP